MVTPLQLDVDLLHRAIQEEYAKVATSPTEGFHFHTGRVLVDRLGYPAARVDTLPESALESFAGVGNPFSWGELQCGEIVVDLGSGAGFDALIAATMVGPSGRVIGIDMTRAMLEKARHHAALLGLGHVGFREAYLEDVPLPDATADVVISNGVINLCPDKAAVLAEASRVLKPGGRLQIADIIVALPVPDDTKEDIALWTG
jgi:SAM-dependent methyltransferase